MKRDISFPEEDIDVIVNRENQIENGVGPDTDSIKMNFGTTLSRSENS